MRWPCCPCCCRRPVTALLSLVILGNETGAVRCADTEWAVAKVGLNMFSGYMKPNLTLSLSASPRHFTMYRLSDWNESRQTRQLQDYLENFQQMFQFGKFPDFIFYRNVKQ